MKYLEIEPNIFLHQTGVRLRYTPARDKNVMFK